MNSAIFEKHVLVKLYHNKNLRKKYLPDILPALFEDKTRRLIIFCMKELHKRQYDITVENITIAQRTKVVKQFMNKHFISFVSSEAISDEVNNLEADSSDEMFEEAFRELHDLAFARYTEQAKEDFTYELGYRNRAGIIARAKALIKIHQIIFKSKLKNRKDGITAAANLINQGETYLRFSSNKLTSILGGWSRGFPAALIGRPSHGKSTFMTWETTWLINKGKISRADIISAEEPEEAFWRRIFAIELNIPIKKMMNGLIKITPEQIQKVKQKYEGKIFFHEIVKYQDIVDLLFSLDSEFIWLDHVNAVVYPKGDMFGGITALVGREKQWLKEYKNSVIVNLSQVNTKEMKRKGRIFPSKEDAFGSSILEHASREFLSIYYPYRDVIDKDEQHRFLGKKTPKPDHIQLSIEKNSYGDTGIFDMRYLYEYGKFEDFEKIPSNINVILPDDDIQEKLL